MSKSVVLTHIFLNLPLKFTGIISRSAFYSFSQCFYKHFKISAAIFIKRKIVPTFSHALWKRYTIGGFEQKLALPFCLSPTSPNHSQYVIIDDRATYPDPTPTLPGYAWGIRVRDCGFVRFGWCCQVIRDSQGRSCPDNSVDRRRG